MADKAPEAAEPRPKRAVSVPKWGLGPREELEAPAELPGELVEAIREHLTKHGIELDLRRDVSWQGHQPQAAPIEAWLASPSGAAGFACAKCQARFFVGEPVPGPLRTSRLLRKNPALAAQLRGTDPAERDELAAAWERGELAPLINEERLRKAGQRSQGKSRRTANTRRREACQELLVKLISEIGTREAAVPILFKALGDKEICIKLTGMGAPPSEETLKKYWSGGKDSVPAARRNAAKAAYLHQPEAKRAQIEKERRYGTLKPPPYLTP